MARRHIFVGLLVSVILTLFITWNNILPRYYTELSFQNINIGLANIIFQNPNFNDHLPEVKLRGISNTFKNIPLSDFAASVSKSYLSSYQSYLSLRNITDLKKIASNITSTQALASNKSTYSLGEVIYVNIKLFDGYGKPLTDGGDILRIWLTSTSFNAHVNGYVIDHGNGSYTGHVRALWTGKCVVKTTIAATKQQIAVVHNYIEKRGLMHDMVAGFQNGSVVERTPCSSKPDVFDETGVCNFTAENYGLHWYCVEPKNPKLSCQDWRITKGHRTDHLNTTERTISRTYKHMLLKQLPTITVTGDTEFVSSPDLPCYKRPNIETWHEETPVGFYYKGKWHQRGCRNTFTPSKYSYEKCLRDQYLFLFGDSNIRSWFDHIQHQTRMVVPKDDRLGNRWFSLRKAVRQDLNSTLLWAVHELPFYTGEDSPRELIKSIAWYMDLIPNKKKVTLVIHNMMHFGRLPPSEFREHVRDMKFAIGRLFQRIPHARVFIKGPHSATYINLLKPLDFIRKFQDQIFYEELMEFHNEITYLNEWDLTTCIGNVNVHPDASTVRDMIYNFMSYLCEE
ncbi:NXPE family member 4-like isoform X1 [Argopecten irradians]|uniref:NXPE family member 4-like isoform X1 n=1 Tax=Argopecten irradians TaxID=31199 RepID=UPI003712E3B7